MKAENYINHEFELRMKLVEDQQFILDSIKIAKQLGITADEWNKNKAMILLMFANEMIGLDNKNGGKLRAKLTN
jgi:hypothetical protein